MEFPDANCPYQTYPVCSLTFDWLGCLPLTFWTNRGGGGGAENLLANGLYTQGHLS